MAKKQTSEPVYASRFDRVRAILRAANGDSTADYQGLNDPAKGQFWWDLDLADFLKLEIAGLRLIAPPGNVVVVNGQDVVIKVPDVADYWYCAPAPSGSKLPSCCVPGEDSGQKSPGRGAASNLIKALKGEAPFNAPAGHFPPFMWGGNRVADVDIQFISDWIDDGCPGTDDAATKTGNSGKLLRLSLGEEAHAVSRKTSNAIQGDRNGLKQRKDVDCLTDDEVCKWRYVHNEMIQLNAFPMDRRNWNYWGRLHGDQCQHGWEQFLLWHRMYLYEFEQRCQDIISDVTIPYWNWPSKRYRKGNLVPPKEITFPKSIKKTIPVQFTAGVLPYHYQCFLNELGAKKLIGLGMAAGIKEMVGFRYNADSEFFWGVEQLVGKLTPDWKKKIRETLIEINPLWYPFRWPAMFYDQNGKPLGEEGMQSTFHHHFPTGQDVQMILKIDQWINFGGGPSYDMSYGALDMDPHNTVHIWVGGFNPNNPANKVVSEPAPPVDTNNYPYEGNFFATEPAMGDMLNNLTACYDPVFWPHHSMVDHVFHRWQELHPGQQPFEPDAQLAGLHYVARDAASTRALGYEYAMDTYHFETDKNIGFSRLNTGQAGVSEYVLDNHARAELRLHRLIQPNRSYGIRVFLNQPDANINTPVVDNDHFAGYVSLFGHGDCIGGPGHCDPPPLNRRLFDQRPVHHNTPRDFKIDVTAAVQKLAAKGQKDFKITLVVMTPDRNGAGKHLQLEGLSLKFFA